MAVEIIGREEELGAVESFLDGIDEGPKALVFSGEPGIGKTILWEAGLNEAQRRVGSVLVGRGSEAEASLSFAGLSDLLAPVFDGLAASLLPPRRNALEIALLRVEPGEVAPDPHAIGLAVLDVLRVLAKQGSVLVALDDAQWLDPASAGVLQIALRRLRQEPVRLLATLRTGPELARPLELNRSFSEGQIEQLTIGPLSLGAVHSLLKERLGLDLTRPELARVVEATAGNPFFTLELGRELVRTGTRPAAGRALPMPSSLQELLGGRLLRLPTHSGDVLLQVSALARPTVELVAAAYGDRDLVLDALEAAVREGVIALDSSHVRFAHPLLASICYEQAPIWKRQAVHRRLADVVADSEERARHLALATDGPDAVVASELDAAAEQAAARGAPSVAAELYGLAAELTANEPALERQRRFRAAFWRLQSGGGERARTILEDLRAEVPRGVERADVLFLLGIFGTPIGTSLPEATELLQAALREAEGDDARCARILGRLATTCAISGDVRIGLVHARLALEKADQVGDPVLLAAAIADVAALENYALDITPGLLEGGVAIEEGLERSLAYPDSPAIRLGERLTFWDEPERARELVEGAATKARAYGDELSHALGQILLAVVDCYVGRWPQAVERAALQRELAEQSEWEGGRSMARHIESLVLAYQGQVEQARSAVEEALRVPESEVGLLIRLLDLGVLGHLELALGDLESAAGHLRELPRRLLEGGWREPGFDSIWPDAIETLLALGETEQAQTYLEQYEAHAKQSSRRNRAGAARCRGLLTAAESDLEGASTALEQALQQHDGLAYPFEHARTLLCLGTARRQAQQKRPAREVLEQALALFEELGARLWADKARSELKRIGGRAPAPDQLTETERRVAELAARGRTNKQIAAELYMGQSTVEAHLSHVYRKLGIRRPELASHLARPASQTAEAMHETTPR